MYHYAKARVCEKADMNKNTMYIHTSYQWIMVNIERRERMQWVDQ